MLIYPRVTSQRNRLWSSPRAPQWAQLQRTEGKASPPIGWWHRHLWMTRLRENMTRHHKKDHDTSHLHHIIHKHVCIYIYPSYHHRPLHTWHYTHNTAYIILHTLRCLLVSTNAVPHTRRIGKDLIRGGFSGEMWRCLGSQRRATERPPLFNIAMEKAPFLDDLLIFTDLPIKWAIEWITIW